MEIAFALEVAAALGLLALLVRERRAHAALLRNHEQLKRDFWNIVAREKEFERLGRLRREAMDRYNAKRRAERAANP